MASDLRFCNFALSPDDPEYGPVSRRLLAPCWQRGDGLDSLSQLHGGGEDPVRFSLRSAATVVA